MIVNEGSKEKSKFASREYPYSCEACPDDECIKARHGCGWDDRWRGKGVVVNINGEIMPTCPQWLGRQPFVDSVFCLLQDYCDGRLGDVRDLPADLLAYLRMAANELEAWKGAQQSRLIDGD